MQLKRFASEQRRFGRGLLTKNKSIALCLAFLVVAALAYNYSPTLADDAANEISDLRAQIAEHEYQGLECTPFRRTCRLV